jgi:hypothetical protein
VQTQNHGAGQQQYDGQQQKSYDPPNEDPNWRYYHRQEEQQRHGNWNQNNQQHLGPEQRFYSQRDHSIPQNGHSYRQQGQYKRYYNGVIEVFEFDMMAHNSNSVSVKPPKWIRIGTENTRHWQKKQCTTNADWSITYLYEFNERQFYDPDAPAQKIINKSCDWTTKHQQVLAHVTGMAKDLIDYIKPRGMESLVQSLEYLDKQYGAPTQRKGALQNKLKHLQVLDEDDIGTLMAAKNVFKAIIRYYQEHEPLSIDTLMASDTMIQNVQLNLASRKSYNYFRQYNGHLDNSVQTMIHWIEDVAFTAQEMQYQTDLGSRTTSTTATTAKEKTVIMMNTDQPDQGKQSEAEEGEIELEPKTEQEQEPKTAEATDMPKPQRRQVACFLVGGPRTYTACPECGGQHMVIKCKRWIKYTTKEKKRSAFKFGACYRCLKGVHTFGDCETEETCDVCGSEKHHTMLHDEKKDPKKTMVTQVVENQNTPAGGDAWESLKGLAKADKTKFVNDMATSVWETMINTCKNKGILHVAVGPHMKKKPTVNNVVNKCNRKEQVTPKMMMLIPVICYRIVPVWARAGVYRFLVNMLFDDGAYKSFITRKLTDWLHITGTGQAYPLDCSFLGGESYSVPSELLSIELESLDGKLITTVDLSRVDQINENVQIPDYNEVKKHHKYLKDYNFPDLEDSPIQILLGFDFSKLFAATKADRVGPLNTDPTGRSTRFGDVLSQGAQGDQKEPMMTHKVTDSERIEPDGEVVEKRSNYQGSKSGKTLQDLNNLDVDVESGSTAIDTVEQVQARRLSRRKDQDKSKKAKVGSFTKIDLVTLPKIVTMLSGNSEKQQVESGANFPQRGKITKIMMAMMDDYADHPIHVDILESQDRVKN